MPLSKQKSPAGRGFAACRKPVGFILKGTDGYQWKVAGESRRGGKRRWVRTSKRAPTVSQMAAAQNRCKKHKGVDPNTGRCILVGGKRWMQINSR